MIEEIQLQWLITPTMVELPLRNQLLRCWRHVANTGGAVGFPFTPVSEEQVESSIVSIVDSLGQGVNRILVSTVNGELAGWLYLSGNSNELTAHWAQVMRVQTAPEFRGRGVGRALMHEVARAASEDLTLEQLHLELRSGTGLTRFYQSCGWQEIGRWPAALRFPQGDRDEVLMLLNLPLHRMTDPLHITKAVPFNDPDTRPRGSQEEAAILPSNEVNAHKSHLPDFQAGLEDAL